MGCSRLPEEEEEEMLKYNCVIYVGGYDSYHPHKKVGLGYNGSGVLLYLYCKYVPVIVFEPWSPVGRAQQRLQDTSQVYERVTHQQEHGQQWSEIVDVSDQYTALAHDHGYDQRSGRFAGRRWLGERLQERYYVVLGYSLASQS